MEMDEREYFDRLNQLWEKNWPSDLPKEPVYPFGQILLSEYLSKWAQKTPDRPCLIYYGTQLTFSELDDLSDRVAGFLAEQGLKKGDRVAVFLPNCPQFIISFFGIIKLGCVHVPVNPMFMEHELVYELNDSGARLIITLDTMFPLVQAVTDKTSLEGIVCTSLMDYLPDNPSIPVHETLLTPRRECPGAIDFLSMLDRQDPDYPDNEVSLDDVVALNYTGGTTGLPKGCEHTQRDMVYTGACGSTFLFDISSSDVGLMYVPIFWIAGEDGALVVPYVAGTTTVLLTRWDPEAALTAIDHYRVTYTAGLVENLVELIEHPQAGIVVSFVKKLDPDIRARWRELTGCVAREGGYGMTETHTLDTFTTGLQDGDLDLVSRHVLDGLPVPGTSLKIENFETGQLAPLGQEGQIVVRSPSIMKSYWNKPEETQRVLKHGWMYTGDIGLLDEEGYIHYLGRTKEMLKVKGMSVFPSEVETFLNEHPGIAKSGVIGQDEPDKGQLVIAFVEPSPGSEGELNAQEITRWCRENMASYKVPIIRIVPQVPMTDTGKVAREELRKLLKQPPNSSTR
jgi:acyl-CoA synthetase (AMP-forming)/AMP-acid ligase II